MTPSYEVRYNALEVDLKDALIHLERLVCGYPSGNDALSVVKGVLIGQANSQTQCALALAELNSARATIKRLR